MPDPAEPSSGQADWKAKCGRFQRLYRIGSDIHSTLDPHQALSSILEAALELTQAASASVFLINPTSGLLELEAARGLPPGTEDLSLRMGHGLCGTVACSGKALRIGESGQDPRFLPIRPGVRSELAAPVDIQGKTRGVLAVDSLRRGAFGEEDQELMEELALQASLVIHNTWLHERMEYRARMFESLASVNQSLQSSFNLDEALHSVTREACNLMPVGLSSLLLLDGSGSRLELRSYSLQGRTGRADMTLEIADSVFGRVVGSLRPVQVEDVGQSGIHGYATVPGAEGLVSLLAVPLIHAEACIGVLSVYTRSRHSFSDEEIRILSAFAAASSGAIEKARLHERIRGIEEQLRRNEKYSALGLLAAEVAHEIRNPLTVMKMVYHSLDLQFGSEDPRRKDARLLGEKMEQMDRIVERVLNFARQSDPQWGRVEVGALLEDLRLLIRHKLERQGIELVCQWSPDPVRMEADAGMLEQAFLNLALNAMEAMGQGGVLTLRTRNAVPAEEGYDYAVEFEDTGEGMSEELRSRLFRSLLDGRQESGVPGFGLAIVGRIVEIHSGEIRIRSAPGEGASFTLLFPRSQNRG